jgi:hypothetical protein
VTEALSIALAATKAPWSAALRSYVRDHCQGIAVEVVVDRAGLARAVTRADVLVVDDVMRTFSAQDIAGAQEHGVHVVGLCDQGAGMGRQYLEGLGADQIVPASAAPADLLGLLAQVGPRRQVGAGAPDRPAGQVKGPAARARKRRGVLCAWTKATGGTGLTEAVVAGAEHLARRSRVLVVEADEVAPVLVSRLLRSPEAGLAWAVSRAARGLRALPEGLSGPRGDGSAPVGHFDVICGTPGAGHVIGAAHLDKLLAEAVDRYDYVIVETSWLVGSPAPRERFSAARSVLSKAGSVVVFTSADPEGAARLVQWKAAALAAGVGAPCWAAFGRAAKSRYERDHLVGLVEANTGLYPYSGFSFLPEDPTVARARWNAEIVWKGPWAKSVHELVAVSVGAGPAGAGPSGGAPGGRVPAHGGPRDQGPQAGDESGQEGASRRQPPGPHVTVLPANNPDHNGKGPGVATL